MAFREKSAWMMGLLMLAAGLWYGNMVLAAAQQLDWAVPPIGVFIPYVLMVIVGSIIVQVALAISAPAEADMRADERERPILDRAGHWSGVVLGFGVVTALLTYLVHADGNLLFHMAMVSLMLSQLSEYGFQILFYRRGI